MNDDVRRFNRTRKRHNRFLDNGYRDLLERFCFFFSEKEYAIFEGDLLLLDWLSEPNVFIRSVRPCS